MNSELIGENKAGFRKNNNPGIKLQLKEENQSTEEVKSHQPIAENNNSKAIAKNLFAYWISSKNLTGVTCFQYAGFQFQITPILISNVKIRMV